MPRNIDLETMKWKEESEYGRNELGTGTEVRDDGRYYGAFLDSRDGYQKAVANLGELTWEMAEEDSEGNAPSAAKEAKANEIFNWAQENLSGKWTLFEHFAYRFSVCYANYLIEEEADREKFREKWGDIFEFTAPTVEKPAPVLTEFEEAQKERIRSHLQEAFAASAQVLPLYKGLPESWTFVSARITGEDKLFILPSEQMGELLCLFGGNIDKNPVRHLAAILEGKNDFVTNSDGFADIVGRMISGFGPDMFRAREVDGYRFALKAQGKTKDDVESYGEGSSLETFRRAYKQGRDVTFHFGGASFTFNINDPLVAYREVEYSGIACSDGHSGFVRGDYHESVSGQYNRRSGAAEGKWTRQVRVTGGVSSSAKEAAAVYDDGHLVDGSLQGIGSDHGKYQPARPKLTILGAKKATPKSP